MSNPIEKCYLTDSAAIPRQQAAAVPLLTIQVGVVAALPAEGQCLTSHKLAPGSRVFLAEATQLQLAGMGPGRASQAAKSLLAAGAKALVSWGVAGGIAPGLKAGTLLLPESVRTTKGQTYYTDSRWRQALIQRMESKFPWSSAPLHQVEAVLSSPPKKAALYQQTRCAAVDMESAAVAKLAAEARIPFLIIRAIADPASAALPPSARRALDLNGQLQPCALMIGLLRQPQDLFGLWQLSRYFRAAKSTLRALAARAGPTLRAPLPDKRQ